MLGTADDDGPLHDSAAAAEAAQPSAIGVDGTQGGAAQPADDAEGSHGNGAAPLLDGTADGAAVSVNSSHKDTGQSSTLVADGNLQSGTAEATAAGAEARTASAENRVQDALIWIDLEMTGDIGIFCIPIDGCILPHAT